MAAVWDRLRAVRRWTAVLAASLGLLGVARADTNSARSALPPLTLKIVRSHKPDCSANCPEWISFEGRITHGSYSQFQAFIRALGSRKLPILINSPGGSLIDALAMGRLIRAKELDVAVSRTIIDTCYPDPKACAGREPTGEPVPAHAFCFSACPIVLAGGVRREVPIDSRLGVHQGALYKRGEEGIPGKGKPLPLTSPFYGQVAAYLAKMGVASGLMPLIKATPPSGIHIMTADEIAQTHIATATPNVWRDADSVVADLYPRHVTSVPTTFVRSMTGAPFSGAAMLIPAAPAENVRDADRLRADPQATPTPAAFWTQSAESPSATKAAMGSAVWSSEEPIGDGHLGVRATITVPQANAVLVLRLQESRTGDGNLALAVDVAAPQGQPLGSVIKIASIGMSNAPGVFGTPLTGLATGPGLHMWDLVLPFGPTQTSMNARNLQSLPWINLQLATHDGETMKLSFAKSATGQNLVTQFTKLWAPIVPEVRPTNAALTSP